MVFDSTLTMLGAAAGLALILGPVFAGATSGTTYLDSAIAALYPLFDLLLIAAAVGVAASPILRIGPRWQFLVGGLLLFIGADITYALLVDAGAYTTGTPLDAAWTGSVAFVAIWVAGVDRVRHDRRAVATTARILPVPAIAVLAILGVLLIATQRPAPAPALLLAAATVALSAVPVMFRQATLARLLDAQEEVVVRLAELDKSKSEMIRTVSHEVRTPSTSIAGYLELVLDDCGGAIPESAKNMLQVVERNTHRLQDLVGNMLMLTRFDSGDATLTAAPMVMARVLHRVAESLRPFAYSRQAELTTICDESVIVEGDESQLERVFTNVTDNAVKFTPAAGSVHIAATALTDRPAALITITDSGIGIPTNELPHLFDRFFRATNAQEEVVPGTELGLAIVRGIVHAHQRDVSVASVLGEGTTFSIKRRRGSASALETDAMAPAIIRPRCFPSMTCRWCIPRRAGFSAPTDRR